MMSPRIIGRSAIVGAIIAFAPGTMQSQTASTVPIREVTVNTKSSHVFANIFQVRQIANRQVLVNDGLRRQLLLLDDKLAFSRVVLDSASDEGAERYGPGAAPFIAALADTTWFVDRTARALLVIDPTGKVVRTTAAPTRPAHFASLSTSRSGVDQQGNLVFRALALPTQKRVGDTTSKTATFEQRAPQFASVLRANFDTRETDTLGTVKQVNGVRAIVTQNPPSPAVGVGYFHPLETVDDWAVLTDGSIAFIRGGDYHIDFVRANGARESGPKLPFDWVPLGDAQKKQILDSAKAVIDAILDTATARGGIPARNEVLGVFFEKNIATIPGAAPTLPRPTPQNFTPSQRAMPAIKFEMVSAAELPDYYPPIRAGAGLGDADNNLWILPSTSAQSKAGELVYDVVSSKGLMIERVRLPQGRSIAGFGRSGVIYLMSREGEGWRLERAQIRR